MSEKFVKIRLGDMYVKDFKIITIQDKNNNWKVKREITLINNKEDGIPIIKDEAQALMKFLDKSAVLDSLGSDKEC